METGVMMDSETEIGTDIFRGGRVGDGRKGMKRVAEEDVVRDPEVERTERILRKLEKMDRKKGRMSTEPDGDQGEDRADVVEMPEFVETDEEMGPVEMVMVEGVDERFKKEDVAVNEETFEDVAAVCDGMEERGDGGEDEVEKDWESDAEDDEEEGKPAEMDEESRRKGRMEEVDFMINTLKMFEFGEYDEAVRRGGGRQPTTTKWVERVRA